MCPDSKKRRFAALQTGRDYRNYVEVPQKTGPSKRDKKNEDKMFRRGLLDSLGRKPTNAEIRHFRKVAASRAE